MSINPVEPLKVDHIGPLDEDWFEDDDDFEDD